jgi:hypothetical protein
VILAAIYLLWLIQKVFYGPITNEENTRVRDIAWNEVAALVPLVILMVWIGVHPSTFLKRMSPSVNELIATVKMPRPGNMMVTEKSQGSSIARPGIQPLANVAMAMEGGSRLEFSRETRSARPLASRGGQKVAKQGDGSSSIHIESVAGGAR